MTTLSAAWRSRFLRGRWICAVLVVSLALGACTGCASNDAQAAAESIEVGPAINEELEQIDAAVLEEKSDDARLVAIRTVFELEPGDTARWQYVYVSRDQVREYTARFKKDEMVVDSVPQAASLLASEMESIPDVSEIALDADAAYDKALEALEPGDEVKTLDAYLFTYVSDGSIEKVDAMTWYFVFNGTPPEQTEKEEYEDVAPTASYAIAVNAVTGDVKRVEVE